MTVFSDLACRTLLLNSRPCTMVEGAKKIILRPHIIPHKGDMTYFLYSCTYKVISKIFMRYYAAVEKIQLHFFWAFKLEAQKKVNWFFSKALRDRMTILLYFFCTCIEKENESYIPYMWDDVEPLILVFDHYCAGSNSKIVNLLSGQKWYI